MIYLAIKAAHIVAIVTWMGGMLASAVAIGSAAAIDSGVLARVAGSIRRWDRRVTTPAMLLAWAFGLALAKLGAWLPAPWLIIKIAIVAGLTALHGVQAGTLRRLAAGASDGGTARRFNAAWIVSAVAAIVALVVLKPA